jgi:hypothetical protein
MRRWHSQELTACALFLRIPLVFLSIDICRAHWPKSTAGPVTVPDSVLRHDAVGVERLVHLSSLVVSYARYTLSLAASHHLISPVPVSSIPSLEAQEPLA